MVGDVACPSQAAHAGGTSKEEVGATVLYTAVVVADNPYLPMRKLLLCLILDINFVATHLGLLPRLSLE